MFTACESDWYNMKLAILIAVLAVVLLGILPIFLMSYVIYRVLLVRTSQDKWEIECERILDDESRKMIEIGNAWEQENAACRKEVSVTSEGLHLFGEYFDFGFDRAVIIIPGRMEAHTYSYFFAEPYKAAHCNVLVIDNRAHGKSEGRRSTLGYREQNDILAWSELLHREYGVRHIALHGICIGAATAVYAMTNPKCPAYLDCLISEGMYTSFYHSFVNHMKLDKRPVFPFALATMFWIALFSKGNPIGDGPANRLNRLEQPALFLHSRVDQFSLADVSEAMYNTCKGEHEVKWFDVGKHSRIKINNRERYDSEILRFVEAVYCGK